MNKIKKSPLRKCVGCGEMKTKKELVRVIKTSENEILIDNTGKKNGRGAYLKRDKEVFEKAKQSKILERHLEISIDDRIYEELNELI